MKKSDQKKSTPGNGPSVVMRPDEFEPVANQSASSAGLIILFGILFFWGTMYLDGQSGNFNAGVYEPYSNEKEVAALRPVKFEDPLFARGRKAYTTYCSPCHQVTGLGAPGVAPPLAGSDWVLDEGPNRMVRIVLNGLQGPINVKGVDWNMAMLAWKDTITDDEDIAGILTYVRGNKDWGNTSPGVTKEEVTKIRKVTAARSDAWTSAELKTIPAK